MRKRFGFSALPKGAEIELDGVERHRSNAVGVTRPAFDRAPSFEPVGYLN